MFTMLLRQTLFSAIIALTGTLSQTAWADFLPVGFLIYNATTDTTAEFDIVNQTGANSTATGDPTWPVATQLSFTGLNLWSILTDASIFSPFDYFSPSAVDPYSFDGSMLAIGGSNPKPTNALVIGGLNLPAVALNDGTRVAILPTFSVFIDTQAGGLQDGSYATIYAETVPEPGTWLLGLIGGIGWWQAARRNSSRPARRPSRAKPGLLACAALLAQPSWATTTINLNTGTTPGSGVAGVESVKVTGSAIPAGTITPANVTLSFAESCGGAPVATATATSAAFLPGSSRNFTVALPGSLESKTYYVTLADPSDLGGITSVGGLKPCSAVRVTHTNKILSACVPTSSLTVSGGPTVTAYVPRGYWVSSGTGPTGATGVQAVQLEPAAAFPIYTAIATAGMVNSCAADSNLPTPVIVCTGNDSSVYIIKNNTLTNTLTSGSNASASFSGGDCQNCGVAVNALTHKAYIAMGYSPSPSSSAIQVLDLATNTFPNPPVASNKLVSEDISVDPNRGLILSPGEFAGYTLFQISGNNLTEFDNTSGSLGSQAFDSAAEDCTTGIGLAPVELGNTLLLTDLTQATFTTGSPGSWSSPGSIFQPFLEFIIFSAGTSAVAVAPGSSHLALASGEFGGNTFGVLQLPATSGNGTPAVTDYVATELPNTPDGAPFSAGYDPHTLTAYTSPNDGRAYGVMAGYAGNVPKWLAVIDLAKVLAATRIASFNYVAPADLAASGAVRYVFTGP